MKIVGLMSGTSADGIDAALCEVEGAPPRLSARLIHTLATPYTPDLRDRILNACRPAGADSRELCLLNADLAEAFAAAVLRLLDEAGTRPQDVDLIGSHGQTVWHEVGAEGRVQATLQIVAPGVLAERTGITTLADFRVRDVAAGGQGAPLTSYVDWLLLRHPAHWRAVQNIGGMGNVTLLPPLGEERLPLAFDTGPGNALIDAAVTHFTGGRLTYDLDGGLASLGRVDEEWLGALLQHSYFQRRPPKTTGRELFGVGYAHQLITEGTARGLNATSIVATLTALTAWSIADSYRAFAPVPPAEVILGGGGARNPALVGMLRAALPAASVLTHEDVGLDSDFKEALVFAVLAYESWHHRPGTLPAFTGAAHPSVLGQITPGVNYPALCRRTWGT
jgi:anhydro-N-acetylmuramic acid kinase